MKKNKLNWTYNGDRFTVGESIVEEGINTDVCEIDAFDCENQIVFFENRLYYVVHFPCMGFVGLKCIYGFNGGKSFWIDANRVFNIRKVK